MAAPRRTPPAAGVSLIEALVALAVMSFGMLALVGVQATMRFNSDVARQRTEATRLATEDLESLRLFSDVAQTADQTHDSWDQLASGGDDAVRLPGNTANTTFAIRRTVRLVRDLGVADARIDAAGMKVVQVVVEWSDRANSNPKPQAVLDGVIMGAAPALSAQLSVPASPAALSRRGGKHVSIPVTARDLGNGTSAFKPFNLGTTVWVLNQTTGQVTSLCTGVLANQDAITSADLSNCTTIAGRLVTGVVRFDLRTTTVDASTSENPAGPALPLNSSTPLAFYTAVDNSPVNQSQAPICVADVPATPLLAASATGTAFACLVFPASTTGWGGRLVLVAGDYPDGTPGNWTIGNSSDQYRVCRYTTASTVYTANTNHPLTYCRVSTATCSERVTQNLTNQNFLVIRAAQSCPTDTPINPAAGNLVNSNTLPHQP